MIDYNCFCGNWPFHKIRRNTFSDILDLHKKNGITGGYISAFESIFYNDPYESELSLYNKIKGSGYNQVLTINPTLDIAVNTVIRGIKELGIKGVRFTPGYHNYSLMDNCVSEVLKILKDYNLPLFLTMHFEDSRVEYLMEYKNVDMDEVNKLITDNPCLDIVLCNIQYNELKKIKDSILKHKKIIIDTSGIRGNINEIKADNLAPYIKFGSMAPLYALKSVLLAYEEFNK